PAPVPPPSLRPLPPTAGLSATTTGADATGTGLRLVSTTPAADVTEARSALADGPGKDTTARISLDGLGWATVVYAETHTAATGAVDATAGAGSLRVDLGAVTLSGGAVDARCVARADGSTEGDASLVDARLHPGLLPAIPLDRTPEPNTVVELPEELGTMVLNEQLQEDDGALTVNALRLELTGPDNPAELVVGSVRCLPGGHAGTGDDGAGAGDGDAGAHR
ncbi:choice-of-anchor P family protein, partial [Streptomyces sp. SM12]|uniref:choice-of-anchor P family protein n=1 Tax=Streptomyces sp. SM12 TaxID=1071602 RepID=UPI000CD4EAFF